MTRHDFMHDVEVVGRGSLTALTTLVVAAFLVLAIGTSVYDVGKWLGAW